MLCLAACFQFSHENLCSFLSHVSFRPGSSHFLPRLTKPFSSNPVKPPTWNSTTTLIITHPTLLLTEQCNSMSQLRQIQAHMTRTGLIFQTFPVSRVLSFCALAETGDIRHAHLLFTQILEPNTYIWNTMIRGYCKERLPEVAFSFFHGMISEQVEMDGRSFVFSLKACEQFGSIKLGELVHGRICKVGFETDSLVRNGLIHLYADNGCLVVARKLFDESLVKDVFSWTAMIDGYTQENFHDEAMRLFHLMVLSGVEPNEVTMVAVLSACSKKEDLIMGRFFHEYIQKNNVNTSINLLNSLLDMYVKCGCLTTAREIFDSMETRDVFSWTSMVNGYAKCGQLDMARKLFDEMPAKNVVSWSAMIAGYSQNNQPDEALKLFLKMLRAGEVPKESTLVSVLSACAQSGCIDTGQWIHNHYINQERVSLTVVLGNAFIDMYSKCGDLDAAQFFFEQMLERDIVSYNSMLVGYASHGHAQKAVILFEQMIALGYKPDDVSFVGILSACNHGGLVNKGLEYFRIMRNVFGLEPKLTHYACMVDLYGRVGLLQEAHNLLTNMPMEPDRAAWGALLNACRMHGNVELGIIAGNKLMDLDPGDSGTYMLLASLCAKSRKWDDARLIRAMMRERGVKKMPGRSSIVLEGGYHEFLSADESFGGDL